MRSEERTTVCCGWSYCRRCRGGLTILSDVGQVSYDLSELFPLVGRGGLSQQHGCGREEKHFNRRILSVCLSGVLDCFVTHMPFECLYDGRIFIKSMFNFHS